MSNVVSGFNPHLYAGSEASLIKGIPVADQTWSGFGSLKGRAFCLIAVPAHVVGAVAKPVVYVVGIALAVVVLAAAVLSSPIFYALAGLNTGFLCVSALNCIVNWGINALTSGPLQLFLAIRGTLGIIDPKIYFDDTAAVPLIEPSLDIFVVEGMANGIRLSAY